MEYTGLGSKRRRYVSERSRRGGVVQAGSVPWACWMHMAFRALSDPSAAFLTGGGEMGRRIRAFDWSQTVLGPPQGWPDSLKTALRIMLASRQPMWVWWGPGLINFYNDAYLPIIGGKHPG